MLSLNDERSKLQKVKIEMVIDLSSHQVDFSDPFAISNYYMIAGKENMNLAERVTVNEKSIKNSKFLGRMTVHHSTGANPHLFPSATKRN